MHFTVFRTFRWTTRAMMRQRGRMPRPSSWIGRTTGDLDYSQGTAPCLCPTFIQAATSKAMRQILQDTLLFRRRLLFRVETVCRSLCLDMSLCSDGNERTLWKGHGRRETVKRRLFRHTLFLATIGSFLSQITRPSAFEQYRKNVGPLLLIICC